MTIARIKDKISQLVSSQLPEFISTDYTAFVGFVEAYYRFLEQDEHAFELIQNARVYSDIDSTASSFISYFLKNYAKDLPTNSLVNKRFFIKRIKDLYESKGSDISFELLFRILYAESVETSHPYDLVLRASDGLWDQRLSIRTNLISGSISNITNKLLVLKKDGLTYTDSILRARLLDGNTYEIFIPSNTTTPFEIGDDVFVGTAPNYDFLGKIVPTTSTLEVIDSGSGFKAGSVFNISLLGGSGTLIKILKTNSSTGIETAKIINYGFGYDSNTNITFDLINGVGAAPSVIDFSSNIGGFVDSIVVAAPQTTGSGLDYFEEEYVETTGGLVSFTQTVFATVINGNYGTSVTEFIEDPDNVAILRFNMGALARYPGEYKSPKGFLSEPDVRLPDDKLYQPFAYQVKSNLDIEVFYDVVKKLIHPAGTNLFSNRTLTNNANIRSNISVLTRSNISLQLHDTLSVSDTQAFSYSIAANSSVSTSDLDYSITLYKVSTDSLSVEDSVPLLTVNKELSDGVIELDVFDSYLVKFFDDSSVVEDTILKSYTTQFEDNTSTFDSIVITTLLGLSDSVSLDGQDNSIIALGKNLSNSAISVESIESISTAKVLLDSQTLLDQTNLLVTKSIANSVSLSDITTGGYLNYSGPYFDYFSGDYVIDPVI